MHHGHDNSSYSTCCQPIANQQTTSLAQFTQSLARLSVKCNQDRTFQKIKCKSGQHSKHYSKCHNYSITVSQFAITHANWQLTSCRLHNKRASTQQEPIETMEMKKWFPWPWLPLFRLPHLQLHQLSPLTELNAPWNPPQLSFWTW